MIYIGMFVAGGGYWRGRSLSHRFTMVKNETESKELPFSSQSGKSGVPTIRTPISSYGSILATSAAIDSVLVPKPRLPESVTKGLPGTVKRFYELALLLYAFNPTQGPHRRHDSGSRLRKFLNAVAYIYDTKRQNGETVTAAALEDDTSKGNGVILWLASNTDITDCTKAMVRHILGQLESVWNMAPGKLLGVEEAIFSKIVEAALPRLRSYRAELKSLLHGLINKEQGV
jgi:hypothetical protein